MPDYHLVVTDNLDIPLRKKESQKNIIPRHFFVELADYLEGHIYEPDPNTGDTARRRLIHRCLNTPGPLIQLAEKVSDTCADGDVIFCIGEAIALPIAYNLKASGKSAKVVSLGHNLYRPRIYVANALWGCLDYVDLFFVYTRDAAARSPKNHLYYEQTDDYFFSPAKNKCWSRIISDKPLVVSVGLEMRDNLTLAEATESLDVEVRITAFSRDAGINPRAVPTKLPHNMSSQFYPWPDLLNLYRSADIVVVPVVPSTYAAGITSILEAAAVGKPIIATGNTALIDSVADPEIAVWVPAEDASALQEAISDLLDDPEKRARLGAQAKSIQTKHHNFDGKIEELAARLRSL